MTSKKARHKFTGVDGKLHSGRNSPVESYEDVCVHPC